MKTKIFSYAVMALIALSAVTGSAYGQKRTNVQHAKFRVWGNCGMCKRTIETAATDVKGVKSADWDMESDTLTVTFRADIEGGEFSIANAVAEAGYDNDHFTAPDKRYSGLHGCCQYERPEPGQFTCSMHPEMRAVKEGTCPVCGMEVMERKE